MEFHLAFNPRPLPEKINHRDRLLLIGSCFTENIGAKLKQLKFSVLENPNGILFNPISIVRSVQSYIDQKVYNAADLFFQNECWNSWEHHSRFSAVDQNEALAMINASQVAAHHFLKTANWIMITAGSAFVYELQESRTVVANCHKVPTDKFNKKLLAIEEVKKAFTQMLDRLFGLNPGVKVIFTISPVRHLRDGFVENNRSKATLIHAIHQLVDNDDRLFYFPAYELVIDDLRDYRFYAEDMVHPNYAATNYVWEKFVNTCIDAPSQSLMKEINTINAARSHKAFNAASLQHKRFLQTYYQKTTELQQAYPYLDLNEEREYFRNDAP